MWHVSSRSGVATFANCYTLVTLPPTPHTGAKNAARRPPAASQSNRPLHRPSHLSKMTSTTIYRPKTSRTRPANEHHTALPKPARDTASASTPYTEPTAAALPRMKRPNVRSTILSEVIVRFQNNNLRWSIKYDIGKDPHEDLTLSLQKPQNIYRKQLFHATLSLCILRSERFHISHIIVYFTARCYASMDLCPSVSLSLRLCLCHKSEFY